VFIGYIYYILCYYTVLIQETFMINNEYRLYWLESVWTFLSIRYRRNGDGLHDVCCSLFPPDASVLFRVEWRSIRRTLEQSWEGGRTYASNAFIQGSCNRLVTLPPYPGSLVFWVLYLSYPLLYSRTCI